LPNQTKSGVKITLGASQSTASGIAGAHRGIAAVANAVIEAMKAAAMPRMCSPIHSPGSNSAWLMKRLKWWTEARLMPARTIATTPIIAPANKTTTP